MRAACPSARGRRRHRRVIVKGCPRRPYRCPSRATTTAMLAEMGWLASLGSARSVASRHPLTTTAVPSTVEPLVSAGFRVIIPAGPLSSISPQKKRKVGDVVSLPVRRRIISDRRAMRPWASAWGRCACQRISEGARAGPTARRKSRGQPPQPLVCPLTVRWRIRTRPQGQFILAPSMRFQIVGLSAVSVTVTRRESTSLSNSLDNHEHATPEGCGG